MPPNAKPSKRHSSAAADLADLHAPGGPVQADKDKRIKELEKCLEEQAIALERARRPRQKLQPASRSKGSSSDFIRVIVPDTHGASVDPLAIKAFLADLAAIKPRQVVMLGDHVDCGGFLAQHHTLGFVAETTTSFEDDVTAANSLLDAVQKYAAPGADIHQIEGNHEQRIEKWCVTQSVGNPANARYLAGMFSTEKVLSLESRGIHFYKQGCRYMDLSIPATIRLGRCYFTHGIRVGVHAAKSTLGDYGANVVFGHTHRIQQHQSSMVDRGGLCAWNVGCLCKLQPYWRHTQITGWGHAYGLQFVKENGDFLHITVPIIDGRSYLVSLTELVVI